jgi:hypothetical protein
MMLPWRSPSGVCCSEPPRRIRAGSSIHWTGDPRSGVSACGAHTEGGRGLVGAPGAAPGAAGRGASGANRSARGKGARAWVPAGRRGGAAGLGRAAPVHAAAAVGRQPLVRGRGAGPDRDAAARLRLGLRGAEIGARRRARRLGTSKTAERQRRAQRGREQELVTHLSHLQRRTTGASPAAGRVSSGPLRSRTRFSATRRSLVQRRGAASVAGGGGSGAAPLRTASSRRPPPGCRRCGRRWRRS